MKSVTPEDLMDHRVFFTEFDRYCDPALWVSDRDVIAGIIERKLKLLLITKSHVLAAASQLLESPFAHDILLKHPALLRSGALVSSMKLENPTTTEFLDRKREEDKEKQNSPYHSQIAKELAELIDDEGTTVRWSLASNSDWFRTRLATDLGDSKSLVRLVLRRKGIITPSALIDAIASEDALSRGDVDRIAARANVSGLRDVLVNYADFIYYLSGARTTNSEGVLPQENLVDFSLSELAGGETNLSEHEVFFKIFIDTVKAKTSTIFPIDFLDSISIEDAIELRNIAMRQEFTEKYNSIQVRTKSL